MKNLICVLMIVAASLISGCTGTKQGELLDHNCSRFIIISKDGPYYIAVDNETGYEYFASQTKDCYTVIGGNVLDKDGHPKKHER